MICDLLEAFPIYLPDMPLYYGIDFYTNLEPNNHLISISLYRIALTELGELKVSY